MKRKTIVGIIFMMLLGATASAQDDLKIRTAAQEAYTASCADSSERVNRPMCLGEEELLQKLAEAGGDEAQMRQNLEQEARLQIKQSRYGTIRRIVAPAAVSWGVPPFYFKQHLLFYPAGKSTSTPADICWVKGIGDGWTSGACAGLSSKYRVLSPVDVVVFDGKIWVFFKPSSSSFMHYFTIDSSWNISTPVKTPVFGSSNPQVTTDGSGIIMSFINSLNSPVVSYFDNSTWSGYSVPATVNSAIAPTPVYDATSDKLWILYVGADNRTYVKRADWSCVTNSGSNCWQSSGFVPNGSGTEFSVAATGSPAGALWGNELYVSQTILGPPTSTKVIYTDSCYDPVFSKCNSESDCYYASALMHVLYPTPHFDCVIPTSADWTHSVPRDIGTNSPGEFHPYNGKLWLFTSNGTFLRQIWKKASGFEIF